MTRIHSISAMDKACEFIKRNLDQGVWQPGERLPSTKRLAASVGVSPVNISKAVVLLKSRGLIHGIPRGPTRAGAEGSAKSADSETGGRLQDFKRTALEKDILSGAYAHLGKLPSAKELQARYRCSFNTLRKILRALASEGVLRVEGRSHILAAYSRNRTHGRIVFITHRAGVMLSAFNKADRLVIETLENECGRHGLDFDRMGIDFYNSIEVRKALMGPAIREPALGYIVDLWWYSTEHFRKAYTDVLAHLKAQKKPVAIIDELATFALPLELASNASFQVFRPQGRSAGGRIGRFLLEKGHHSVAYLSSTHNFSWSQERLAGIRDQFSNAGRPHGVKRFVWDTALWETIDATALHIHSIPGLTDDIIRRLSSIHLTGNQAEEMFRAVKEFRERDLFDKFDPDDFADYRRNFANLAAVIKRNPSQDFLEEIYEAFLRKGETRLATMTLGPLFKKAANDRTITAWVCANDSMAFSALSFLRERKIAVPGVVSVIGFDNTPVKALDKGLTSFDFNVLGAVHHILNFIGRPPRPRGLYRHAPIEVEGMIIERGSTGR
jgi:DNA-binding LacI/PurR family transcriptional regulator/DNA-binding transcriptional regulator YhcF (GntR family)